MHISFFLLKLRWRSDDILLQIVAENQFHGVRIPFLTTVSSTENFNILQRITSPFCWLQLPTGYMPFPSMQSIMHKHRDIVEILILIRSHAGNSDSFIQISWEKGRNWHSARRRMEARQRHQLTLVLVWGSKMHWAAVLFSYIIQSKNNGNVQMVFCHWAAGAQSPCWRLVPAWVCTTSTTGKDRSTHIYSGPRQIVIRGVNIHLSLSVLIDATQEAL